MNPSELYSKLLDLTGSVRKEDFEKKLGEIANLMCGQLGAVSMRFGYERVWYAPEGFLTTPYCEGGEITIDNVRGTVFAYECYFADENKGLFGEVKQNGVFDVAMQLVKSYVQSYVVGKLSYERKERRKEQKCIKLVNEIISRDLQIKETLKMAVEVIPPAMQYPEISCAEIVYEEKHYQSTGFRTSAYKLSCGFVTLDNTRGEINIYYKEQRPDEDDGPFYKEELVMVENLAKTISAYINNYKGRDLFNNIPKQSSSVSTGSAVSEDFRKTLTRDKRPLQLYFNKQILEKYVYLDMMKYKVKNILFVATLYDAFILDTDDSFFEQFMGEIYQYSLFSLPRITGVTTGAEALELMEASRFDLAILMVGLDHKAVIKLSEDIKQKQDSLPVFLLLNKTNDVKYFERLVATTPSIDNLFVWSGNSQIFFSIVKSIEDHANVENDTKIGLVRVILLVEDSPIYYSKYLQILFGIVFGQVQKLLTEEERNEINKISKMRQRPKILHARNYEDAMYIYKKYKDFMLCVISDLEFEHNGEVDDMAGYKLLTNILHSSPLMPVILQSSEPRARELAHQLRVHYMDKNSETIQTELMQFVESRLGFGDFVFRSGGGTPIAKAKGLKEFEILFRNIPSDMLGRFCKDNRISSWLMSRGEISLAKKANKIYFDDYKDVENFRQDVLTLIRTHREDRRKGKLINIDEIDEIDEKNIISLASGSMGGKGRGLAFINTLIQNIEDTAFADRINLRLPITAIVGTDEFSEFMQRGELYQYVLAETDYVALRRKFAEVPLSDRLMERLTRLLTKLRKPVAVRSSSLSEDSMNQPFAGVFDTYLVPNNHEDIAENVKDVATAIRMVYASIYSGSSRSYFQTIHHPIEEEKMAVVIQELVGNQYENYFYPHLSGTAQSYNYYPVAHMKPDEGFAVAGFGLGYYVVGGQKAYRFSPAWPNIDIVCTADMVKNTQVDFLAVDLSKKEFDFVNDGEDAPLATLDIMEAEKHGTLRHCASVYNPQNDTIEPGLNSYGPRVVNFADILKYDYIPLAKLLSQLLTTAKEAMGSPVEIEWSIDLEDGLNDLPSFYLLQMKPIVSQLRGSVVDVAEPSREEAVLYTTQSLGNGELKDITDIIYVDPELFDNLQTEQMAKEIDYLNHKMMEEDRNYVLIGAGRWGTRDKFIGIPVQWSQISMAKVIVEMSLPNFPLDSSLGSHFFHNVTSMNIGYLSVQDGSAVDYINWDNIKLLETVEETTFFKHKRASGPLEIKMNGKERKSVITLPKK